MRMADVTHDEQRYDKNEVIGAQQIIFKKDYWQGKKIAALQAYSISEAVRQAARVYSARKRDGVSTWEINRAPEPVTHQAEAAIAVNKHRINS